MTAHFEIIKFLCSLWLSVWLILVVQHLRPWADILSWMTLGLTWPSSCGCVWHWILSLGLILPLPMNWWFTVSWSGLTVLIWSHCLVTLDRQIVVKKKKKELLYDFVVVDTALTNGNMAKVQSPASEIIYICI